jgi:hypothetical protein
MARPIPLFNKTESDEQLLMSLTVKGANEFFLQDNILLATDVDNQSCLTAIF